MTEMRIRINYPENINSDEEIQKYLWERYRLDLVLDEESDEYEELFYNADLRSFCGFLEEFPDVIVLFPKYYKEGWEDSYYKNLIIENEIIEQ